MQVRPGRRNTLGGGKENIVPHNLHIENGKASMMYVGEVPWHRLGTKLDRPATAEEAILAAKLDWQVVKKPLYATDGRAARALARRYAVVREDTWGAADCPVFGVVGEEYTPLQNREAFAFFDGIVGKGAAIYHTAGALGRGERVWILARLPECIRVVGNDITDKYLLLSNGHDGNSAVQVKFTPVRVVCQNTLTLALSQGPTIRVTHTRDVRKRLAEAERLLGIIRRGYERIGEWFGQMACVPMTAARLDRYLRQVFPPPCGQSDPRQSPTLFDGLDPDAARRLDRAWARVEADRSWAAYFFEHGKGNGADGVRGTLWAAYNAVAEMVDHGADRRRAGGRRTDGPADTALRQADRHLASIWFGDGHYVKARAFAAARALLSATN